MAIVKVTNDGFQIDSQKDDRTHLRWVDIREIFAFKIDLWAFDTIRLGFRIDDSGERYEVDEDWPGYKDLVAEIERRFDVRDDWFSKVAFPALNTNRTTLWGEPPAGEK